MFRWAKKLEYNWRKLDMQALLNLGGRRALVRTFRVLAVMALLSASVATAAEPGTEDPSNWPQYHRTGNGWRHSPLDQINTKNVQKLSVAWIHQPGDIAQGLQATPITIDGVLYYIGPNNRVFAIDGATGRELWKYVTKLDPKTGGIFFAAANRGVTVGRGKVYFGTLDGRAIALDQRAGTELWNVPLTEFAECQGCNFSSPPTLAEDVLVFGPTGGELANAGRIYGVNADTGQRVWTFDVLKNDPKSWPGASRAVGGGGAWMPGQFDPDTGNVYIGTSNAAPDFDGPARDGDNLYTASLLAIDAKSGRLNWYHQEVPHDVWDFDSTYESLLINRDGKDLLVHLNKGGYVSILNKRTGELSNVWAFAKNINWVERIDPRTGQQGGRNEP
jgi:alcohol dehydrogenase (cytochrome c)